MKRLTDFSEYVMNYFSLNSFTNSSTEHNICKEGEKERIMKILG